MNLRLMTMEDYDALWALWLATPGMGLNDVDDSREGIGRYLARNPSTCFVAERDGVLIGAILAGHDGRRGYISHTAVRVEERKQGVGSALVRAALAALRDAGISKVALVAVSRNEIGNAFWEQQGFPRRDDLSYRDRTLVEMKNIYT